MKKTFREYAIGEKFEPAEIPVHFAVKMPKKWETGVILCGYEVTSRAFVTRFPNEVTCPNCLAKMTK